MNRNVVIAIIVGVVVIAGVIIVSALKAKNAKYGWYGEVSPEQQPIATQEPMNSELKIEDAKVGTGKEAKAGDTVSVHYVSTFPNGSKFDSSRDREEPFSFTLGAGQVIQGWDRGVLGMKEGGIRKLTVPPDLGYGPNDYGPIPGGSTLHFEIELLKVEQEQE